MFVQVLELFLRENCGEEREFGLLFWCVWVFWRNFCGWWLHGIKGVDVEWFLPLHLLLGVVVSSHHAQQLHESNKKKPVVAQARIGMLVR